MTNKSLFLRYHRTSQPYKLISQTTLTVVFGKNVLCYISDDTAKRKTYGYRCIWCVVWKCSRKVYFGIQDTNGIKILFAR